VQVPRPFISWSHGRPQVGVLNGCYGAGKSNSRVTGPSLKLSFSSAEWRAAMQREEPVGASGRTHGIRHQADVRFCHQRRPERQLYEVQPTSGRGWAVSLLRRLLPCRANWRYRPRPGVRLPRLTAAKQSMADAAWAAVSGPPAASQFQEVTLPDAGCHRATASGRPYETLKEP
jgi:hypothetical protein